MTQINSMLSQTAMTSPRCVCSHRHVGHHARDREPSRSVNVLMSPPWPSLAIGFRLPNRNDGRMRLDVTGYQQNTLTLDKQREACA